MFCKLVSFRAMFTDKCSLCLMQQTLVDKVSRRQRVDMSLLFLNIKVRRLQLVSDSLDEVILLGPDL